MLDRIDDFISRTLGLTKLPPHLPTLLWSFLGFLIVHQFIAPALSARYFPTAYGSKGRTSRNNWSIHVVSQVHTLIIVPLALWCILSESPDRAKDPAFGWDERAGFVHAIAAGYFLWDTLDAIVNFTDLGFVIHGLACFAIYTMSYKPFVTYYATRCLLWEASTFFLNIHWFLDKTNRTGTNFQLINGILLLCTFFGVRLVYGGTISIKFFLTLLDVRHDIPLTYTLVYGLGNAVLQGLNWMWFTKMIAALKKRFQGTSAERAKLVRVEEEESGYSSSSDSVGVGREGNVAGNGNTEGR
ncbi:TLC domain-containing protein [Crucibulum laeve]|uniref:TLC domain-containing protein n=1 Tax=Crucibulum laeve TaxID=68775 RepID=A0A5C3MCF9_9AGAR|nr:TLC domain-containing protein [Crucibulum laeve]